MPLPAGGEECWPPEHCEPINRQIATWAAWYEGSIEKLAAIYAGEASTGTAAEFSASQTGGIKAAARRVIDKARRWFWGNRNPGGQPRNRLHVPLAGDIAAASADLLFSQPPTITVDQDADGNADAPNPTQDRLDDLMDDGTHATLLEAAEICAALGGVFLRVCWDPDVNPDRPWIAAVHPDAAVPSWRLGKLTEVTFWRVIREDNRKIVRHLEHHEPGWVRHAVYEGEDDQLGTPVPLEAYPETAGLEKETQTGTEVLTASYVPNMRPNRVWRSTPGAASLGRSDYAGAEPLMDTLDLTYSSLARDIELGKARLIVPAEYMQVHGKGQGASVDLDREVYEAVNVMGGDEGKPAIEQVQFAIRIDEHERAIHGLKVSIVGAAGYSAQTFGLEEGGQAITATEVAAQTRRSLITRDRKTRYWGPGLADITEAWLGVLTALFNAPGVEVVRPTIEWPDAVSEDPQAVAATVEIWQRSQSASTKTRVERLHPDWDDKLVAEEVGLIVEEYGLGEMEDPGEFRGLLNGQSDNPQPDQARPAGAPADTYPV